MYAKCSHARLSLQLFVEESGPRRWTIVEDVPLFAKNGTEYLTVAPLVDGGLGTYPHIHQGARDSKHPIPLTFGPYTVFSILAWDTDNHHVYVTKVLRKHL